ncbi:MAG: 50S ribosomal protein L30 [Propionibacteriaceae bacterium]|jgi:large subunit ribosomal protein L30|nr:50S ribosomal protein L30 [Propionibacteriaceae bacterium]
MAQLAITQIKSGISQHQNHRDTLRSLGLKRIGHSVIKEDTRQVQGMVRTVSHLVRVEEVK